MTEEEAIEEGSLAWVVGVMDWEGMPDALEHIKYEEIKDEELGDLWYDAQQEYQILEGILNKIDKYIASKQNNTASG